LNQRGVIAQGGYRAIGRIGSPIPSGIFGEVWEQCHLLRYGPSEAMREEGNDVTDAKESVYARGTSGCYWNYRAFNKHTFAGAEQGARIS
jgi:hypothetical protein